MKAEEIRKAVRDRYGDIAAKAGTCCLPAAGCCGGEGLAENISLGVGYRPEDLQAVPDGANLGLGCGNPVALASLQAGETVVDLGAGAGFDCFLAAKAVGEKGRVIGVDMTPEMLDKARANARKGNYGNVEFRLGEIENLPVADNTADIIISNCVINLSPDKGRVFREAFRVLKPGGRLMVSDIVLRKELPAALHESVAAYTGCVAGALRKDDYLEKIAAAGFTEVRIIAESLFPMQEIIEYPAVQKAVGDSVTLKAMAEQLATSIASIKVAAVKASTDQ
ncbi:MAG TPA: arsenite methyltransferase [Syntrophales bacterium]|jgi:ubiquinone/menaquinone biosynthesis C-methylase UbiE|nr:arsenite methyltransferase [Syntrophales bacterium]HON23093.1 arsenite methyltransferase [Syntrophales bacterium]HOU76747.1 arsenite methyltransferase [Syntrophales bacterium]HQG35003.1 arsenite methyltransferase [Syntrophales bacterium]HQI34705.1 arsenite methyltransferase [Syntrophales bacterium]